MKLASQTLPVSRRPYRIHAEVMPGAGPPVVLMHGFPDNTHLYDRLVPFLAGSVLVVRFDFLGWGRSEKPIGYPYTADNQAGDLAAVADAVDEHLGSGRLVLVAHDASGPPAIDWALANPGRVATLVLLNTYYHWIPVPRRPPAIALYSSPVIRAAARAVVRRRPDLDRRLYAWQVGKFIIDPELRAQLVPQLYEQFLPARPAFWRLNDDLITATLARRRIPELRRFGPPVRVIFGADDQYLACSCQLRRPVPPRPTASDPRCRALRPSRPATTSSQPHRRLIEENRRRRFHGRGQPRLPPARRSRRRGFPVL
jgi:pimeloyl-ACP methyl ester carboxylesterase